MKGICDTCEQICEVFLPDGRTDLICSDCYVNVGTAVQLYQALKETASGARTASELEAQLKMALIRLFSRTPYNIENDESNTGQLVCRAFDTN